MKKILKQALKSSLSLTTAFALSLTIALSLSGGVSAVSVTETAIPQSSQLGISTFTDGISSQYPYTLDSFEDGGTVWSFGPDEGYDSPGGRRAESFYFNSACGADVPVSDISYTIKYRIIQDSQTGALWFFTGMLTDPQGFVSLTQADSSVGFNEYTYSLPAGSYTLNDIDDNYSASIMYENLGASGLNVEIDSISRTLTYDDSSCPTPPVDPVDPVDPTPPTTPTTLYCPAPGNTSQLLTPEGDCDGDGITNKEEGYDPDEDGNPETGGTTPRDTDGDGTPDYLDTDSDNDTILDKEEGTKDSNGNGIPDYIDPSYPTSNTKGSLASTGTNTLLLISTSLALTTTALAIAAKKFKRS